jgi:iron complex outermembrane receptor protein
MNYSTLQPTGNSRNQTNRVVMLVLILCLSFLLPAFAQDQKNTKEKDKEKLEDVIVSVVVTAQKREQNVQEIGMAIETTSGDEMKEKGITNGVELAEAFSNVSATNVSGGGLPIVIIRGVGLQNFRINDSPTTSFYIDEVYQTSIASAEFSMFDLDHVELLKGPQGGLYGRNTIGGAIQVISKRPDIDKGFSGYAMAGYGTYSSKTLECAANIPLSDTAAARISVRSEKSDDTVYRSTTDGFNYGKQDQWAARFQLSYQPNDSLDINIKLHGGNDQSELPLLRTVGLYKNIGTAADFGAPNLSLGLLGGLMGIPGTGLSDSILAGLGSNPNTSATLSGVTPAEYGLGSNTDNRYDSAVGGTFLPKIDNQWQGANMIANYDFGDLSLTSVTAYDHIDYNRQNDADGTPVELQHIVYGSKIDAWQQEVRLSNSNNETVTWLIGINYSEDTLKENSCLYGADGVLPLFFGGATFSPQIYKQKTKALAAYGHGEWRFADQWNFVGELRFTKEDKSFKGRQDFGFPNGETAPFLAADDSTSFEGFSGKLALEWSPRDKSLVYGSISRGFKTGGFFGGFATHTEQLKAFNEETIMSYEMGFKTDLIANRLRLNSTIFLFDRQDVQQNAKEMDEDGGLGIARLNNIGDVESKGFEIDMTWKPVYSLSVQIGMGYIDSGIVASDFIVESVLPLSGNASLEGTNTPNYSKLSSNIVLRYEEGLSDNLFGNVQLEYSYRSERDLSMITKPELEDPLFKEPAYGLLNLRLGLGSYGYWKVNAFVENMTNEVYRLESRSDGLYGVRELYGAERTYGISCTLNWD